MQGADRDKEQELFRRTLVPLHVERESYLTRKYISASGYKHNCTDVAEFANEYFRFLWKLVVLGLLTKRLAVLPPMDCASPWISRYPKHRDGIEQVQIDFTNT